MSRVPWSLLVVVLASCGDNIPPPVEVSAGRLTARISAEPAKIALVLDGQEVWTTRGGGGQRGDDPPHGFAATGSLAVDVEMMFGSFRFTEAKASQRWRAIDRLADITPTADGATFTLRAGDTAVGTGTLTFVTATRSGADPAAAGFPRHVRIELAADAGDRIQLAATTTADEHLVGLGGQSFDVDHRGETVPLWVQEDGIGKYPDPDDIYAGLWFFTGRKHSTHTPMPMVLSSRGYAIAIDTDARAVFALGSEAPDVARFEAWEHRLDVNVFIGDGPRDGGIEGAAARDAFGHMIAWVGKPARPPETIFAPWVDAMFGSANVRRVAQRLRSEGIGASVIWTEDWRGGETTATTGYALHEDWRVDRGMYPDFEQLAIDVRALGYAFHTYHNTFIDQTADIRADAEAGGYTIKNADGAPYSFTGVKFNPSTLLDLSNPDAVAWGKSVMREAHTLGSDGWMADFAEWLPADAVLASGEDALAVHNRYPVDWARFNQELFATAVAGRPAPIYFMRSAWLHSQPLVQVMWAGDQQTDWSDGDGLPSVIPIGLGLGLAGFPYFGHDIGGYMDQGTTPTSEELFYRWTSFGALSPVMRTHHGRNVTENVQWEHDAGTVGHFRRWTRFHLQLATYLHGSTASYERDGLPLFRLIALDHPDDDWAWTRIDEYLLGDRILVAPIQQPGATTRTVQLPAGSWMPLFGGAAVSGEITATAPRTEIPAFVPAGSLLVLYPDGVATVLDAPASAATLTTREVGADREVWLYSGTASNPDHARWHDDAGITAAPQWTWTGRAGALPASATFNDAAVTVTVADGIATVTVTGDGTLTFAGGGTLTISRGNPTARATIKLR
ncbi:MAG: hypothetical protein H0T89_26955 [Deltaproteobacteria bacterium]|nr:hypothetical protein [Deltaproteobacteria bacterium]MDQ3300854.1 hypothetical protein [Myxococcota bacterium]